MFSSRRFTADTMMMIHGLIKSVRIECFKLRLYSELKVLATYVHRAINGSFKLMTLIARTVRVSLSNCSSSPCMAALSNKLKLRFYYTKYFKSR